jgi:hypothetical protein
VAFNAGSIDGKWSASGEWAIVLSPAARGKASSLEEVGVGRRRTERVGIAGFFRDARRRREAAD